MAPKRFCSSRKKFLRDRINERKERRARQVEDLATKIAVNGVFLTPERQEILKLPAPELIARMKSGSFKCVDVLRAFQAKAIEATMACNCVVEFINEAEEWSRSLDMTLNENLPLRGLPVSIKEDFAIANYDNTLGYAKFLGQNKDSDAAVVATLKQLGAIPFCRTNVPQTLISSACSNPIYGATLHPLNPNRGPGGSSGGEAALIASGGSVLGIGSDIGGSVRIAALFCGIVALKPTRRRISDKGQQEALPGIQGVCSSPGILAKDVDTAIFGVKALLSTKAMHDMDPPCLPLPWRDELFGGKHRLRIGYYESSNVFPPTPGVRRAHWTAVEALRAAGHVLIPFECPDSFDVMHRIIRLLMADKAKTLLNFMKDEKVDRDFRDQHITNVLPMWIKALGYPFLRLFARRASFVFADSSSHQLWKSMQERQELINHTISRWKASRLDLLLTPGFAFPSIPTNKCGFLFASCVYTILFNHLDFPAGVVPVTTETNEDQAQLKFYDTHRDVILMVTKKVVRGSEGLPLGVQIVGLPWQEELVLRGMKELQDALKK